MLPNITPKNYTYEINGKVIKFSAWKTKQEREFLIFQQSKENHDFNDLFDVMAKPCIENIEELNLTYGEKQMILIEIRKKSYGNTVEFNYSCNKCGSYNETNIDISDIVEYKPGSFEKVTKDGFTFEYETPTEIDFKDIDIADIGFVTFAKHIKSITYQNEVHKDFTQQEIVDFLNDMPSDLFDYFFNEYNKNIETIEYKAEGQCLNCKNKQDLRIHKIPNFFPW